MKSRGRTEKGGGGGVLTFSVHLPHNFLFLSDVKGVLAKISVKKILLLKVEEKP